MADETHPHDSPPVSQESQPASSHQEHSVPRKWASPLPAKPVLPPPSGTYIVSIPKDQVLRVPPPENARLLESYARRKKHRIVCRCCPCWLIGLIFILVVILAIVTCILYRAVKAKRFEEL